ncbi:hypothetical protein B9Z55_027811 [Caenorhabditis nigoni]|nr:hypothetical protein B9Z55_027811 [Caenorhabditis nigoni]
MTIYQRYNQAFRYIAENVKKYKNPESLALWRKECENDMPDIREYLDFRRAIDRRINRIASTLYAEGYTFLEKVHLVFIFSWAVNDTFVKIVQEAKCTIKLDRANRIKYFRSEDGSVILSSDHKKEEKFFKGTLLTAKRQRSRSFARSSKEVRPSQPIDSELADDTNENDPDSEESESEDETPTNVSDSQNSEYSIIQDEPFNGRINYDELDKQELDVATYLNHERSFGRKPEKRPQNSWSSRNAKKVKTEEWDEELFTASDAPEALNNPEDAKINVLLLANNIGIIALYCDLEDVQKKAPQAIEMIKMEEREMTLNVADFNSFIDSMLKSIKRSKIRHSRQNEKFLPLKTIYRHIKLSLILPFGPEVTGEALKIVDKEIEELGERRPYKSEGFLGRRKTKREETNREETKAEETKREEQKRAAFLRKRRAEGISRSIQRNPALLQPSARLFCKNAARFCSSRFVSSAFVSSRFVSSRFVFLRPRNPSDLYGLGESEDEVPLETIRKNLEYLLNSSTGFWI